ncbi:putative BAG family molecular chaperone regulator/7/8 [Helianthus anomalus]
MMIQIMFKAYLIRKYMALRALRDLATAKGKLKEVKALYNNYSYRRRLTRDKEERQKFSERIIVLLLTVDAIEVNTWSFYVVSYAGYIMKWIYFCVACYCIISGCEKGLNSRLII